MREVQGAICIASIVQLVIGYTGVSTIKTSMTMTGFSIIMKDAPEVKTLAGPKLAQRAKS